MKTINDQNYVDIAEETIKHLKDKENTDKRKKMVSMSKIRNLLSMTADIYNNVLTLSTDRLNEEQKGRIEYLRMRFIYEYGRNDSVKDFVTESKILTILKEIAGSRDNYILFNHYMEALVAFHKFYGGKDYD